VRNRLQSLLFANSDQQSLLLPVLLPAVQTLANGTHKVLNRIALNSVIHMLSTQRSYLSYKVVKFRYLLEDIRICSALRKRNVRSRRIADVSLIEYRPTTSSRFDVVGDVVSAL